MKCPTGSVGFCGLVVQINWGAGVNKTFANRIAEEVLCNTTTLNKGVLATRTLNDTMLEHIAQ
jgi:hypothetical protein